MKNVFPIILFLYFNSIVSASSAQTISTIAGTGISGCTGDGGPATNAELGNTRGIAVDSAGNVYFQDYWYHRVRKVSPTGIISTIAGTGVGGYSGDGGPATNATIDGCNDVIVDSIGNVYIAEVQNARIRKITTSGIITTIAGNGSSIYSGDGGLATATGLTGATGLTMDRSGNIYIVEGFSNVVRKVNSYGIITTVAGNEIEGFSGDGGPATAASFRGPSSVAVDRAGNVFIADNGNRRIRKITPDGIVTTYAGDGVAGDSGDGGPATAARFITPNAVSIDQFDNLYVCDGSSNRVRKISPDGHIVTIAGIGSAGYGGDGGPATNAQITPYDMVTDQHGNLFIAELNNMRIRKIACTAPPLSIISGTATTCAGSIATLTTVTTGGIWNSADISVCSVNELGVVTAFSAGTAIISYAVSNSCFTATDTIVFNVISAPDTGIIIGSAFVCEAGLTTLSVTATGGTWTSNSPATATVAGGMVTGLTPGAAIISYTATNMCGTATDTMLMTVNPIPDAGTITGPTNVCVGSTITLAETTTGGMWISSTGAADVTDGVVTGISSGNVIIFYSVTTVCGNASDTMAITINDIPNAGIISDSSSICIGNSATLGVVTGGGTWSTSAAGIATVDGTGQVWAVATGSATISYNLSNSCGADTATTTISVISLPDAGAISGTDSICAGNSVSLSVSASTTGTWSSSNTLLATVGSTGVVTGLVDSTVTILYISSNICGNDTASYTMTILPAASCPDNVNSIASATNLMLYPNPSEGSFTIAGDWTNNDAEVLVEVFNIVGQVVYSQDITVNSGSIKTLLQTGYTLSPGAYMVRVSGATNQQILRLNIAY